MRFWPVFPGKAIEKLPERMVWKWTGDFLVRILWEEVEEWGAEPAMRD